MTFSDDGRGRAAVVLGLLTAAVLALVGYLMLPFLQPVFFAVVLAIAFQPLHQAVLKKTKRPAVAATLSVVLLVLLVLVPLIALGVTIAHEARAAYQRLAEASASTGGWGSYLASLADPPIRWVAERTNTPVPDVQAAVLERLQHWSAEAVGWSGALLGNLTSTVGNAALSLFVLFFLFLEGREIHAGILQWLPLRRARSAELLRAVSDSIVANVYGIAAVGAAQGLLTGLGFLFTGLGTPILWGVVAGICSLVPLVGTALVWLPGVIVLAAQGSWGRAVFLLLWGAIVVGMSDHFVRPWVLSGRTEMNTLVVFFALMGGLQAFGFIGVFAGPVIFSVAICLLRIVREELVEPQQSADEG